MLEPDLEAVLRQHRNSTAAPIAIARVAPGRSPQRGKPADGFLELEAGHDIEILSMDRGPSGAWVARDHAGAVGFVHCNDVIVQHFDLDQDVLVEMLHKARVEATQEALRPSSTSPASSSRSSLYALNTRSPTPMSSRPASSQSRRARRKSSSMIHRLISRPNSLNLEPYEMCNCLEERRRSITIGSANAIKTHKRAPPGYLELSKGDSVEVLATKVDQLPAGVWIGRDASGRVGFVDSSDLHMALGYLKFGQDLIESYKGTRRRVPKVVASCVAFLTKYGLEQEGVFRVPGRTALIEELRAGFENDVDMLKDATPLDFNVSAVAGLLKLFLRELPNPVFTRNLHDTFREIARLSNEDDRIAQLKETIANYLPTAHTEVLRDVLNLLHAVAERSEINKMSAANLAVVFAPTLMRKGSNKPPAQLDSADALEAAMQDDQLVKDLLVTCISRVGDIFPDDPTPRDGSPSPSSSSSSLRVEPWRRVYIRRQLSQSPHSASSSVDEGDALRRMSSGSALSPSSHSAHATPVATSATATTTPTPMVAETSRFGGTVSSSPSSSSSLLVVTSAPTAATRACGVASGANGDGRDLEGDVDAVGAVTLRTRRVVSACETRHHRLHRCNANAGEGNPFAADADTYAHDGDGDGDGDSGAVGRWQGIVRANSGPRDEEDGDDVGKGGDSSHGGGDDGDAEVEMLHAQLEEQLQLPSNIKRWSAQHVATYLKGCGLGISESALQALSNVSGAELVSLNKDKLRYTYHLHETDVAKIASLIFELVDPRAEAAFA
ncbi:hypothetical protein PTSG_12878 [Salpingoeca rosetta]|uniref:Rho-GAP domain-containing protein n=1 Tax=Salpingoeca rosetta (strain ATCC 50818 / BSB-021) TaxID=946362 RepID=F2UMF3_SALR5|nr:uncharacterized protein PTSG_12878 [Salpingoeca rosetta]EGD78302.1 hypothetical protein PTSG_12878 [Salpingoeca rosetta]|eukprot:XP_004989625.1 hypothetical protein PTSG_12878 [Salpingoeca rosetta]